MASTGSFLVPRRVIPAGRLRELPVEAGSGITIMYKYFAKEGCKFSDHTAINDGLEYRSHGNGSRLLIKYLTEEKWSKTLRNRKVRDDDDLDVADDICDLYLDLCGRETVKHSKIAPLWIGNNDIRNEEFTGERLKNVPHGMNSYMTREVCCICSARRTSLSVIPQRSSRNLR
jgi:hypothetical protein